MSDNYLLQAYETVIEMFMLKPPRDQFERDMVINLVLATFGINREEYERFLRRYAR